MKNTSPDPEWLYVSIWGAFGINRLHEEILPPARPSARICLAKGP